MTDRSVMIRLGLDPDRFNRGLASAGLHARAFVKDLDSTDSRMTNIIQTGLALGPTLVPVLGAVAGAGIGLAESVGTAAIAAGVGALAFNGIGDALKALRTFELDPTSAHLEDLHEKLSVLGPDGQRFVAFLDQARPELERLQGLAAHGLLPGVTDGLESLMSQAPEIENLVSRIAEALGQVSREGGNALDSPFWTDFIRFVSSEGRDSLVTMLHIIGQLTKGAAALVMDFSPLSQDVGDALLGRAEAFAGWAQQLDRTEGFQSFMEFVDDVSPDVWDTFVALANALVQVTEAAAPVGEVTLPVIETLANVISAIADSPVGPILIGTAAGLSAISRAVALYNATSGSALGTLLFGDGTEKKPGLLGGRVSARTAGLRGLAAGVSVLALSFTDLDESLGLSNTANFAAIGSVGGPWGAAVGGLIGLMKDLTSINDDADASIRRVQSTLENPGDLSGLNLAISNLRTEAEKVREPHKLLGVPLDVGPLPSFFRDQAGDDADAALEQAVAARARIRETLSSLINVSAGHPGDFADFTGDTKALTQAAADAAPVLDRMGVTLEQVVGMHTLGGDIWRQFVVDFNRAAAALDSQPARAGRVISAFDDLDSKLQTTASSADELQQALDELLSPQMDLQAAADAYTTALRHMDDDLASNSRTLRGNSDAAITNRAAIRDRVDGLTAELVALARTNASGRQVGLRFQELRQRLLDAAEAAGFAREDVAALIKQVGLTPRLVRMIIEANTSPAQAAIDSVTRRLVALSQAKWTAVIDVVQAGHIKDPRLSLPGGATGGLVEGPGTRLSDSIAVRVSDHEFIQRAAAVDKYGVDAHYAINAGVADRDTLRSVLGLAAGGSPMFGPWQGGFTRHSPSSPNTVSVVHVAAPSLDGMSVVIELGDGDTVNGRIRAVSGEEVGGALDFERAVRRQDG